mmetsp:Transcript_28412/g.54149  ORF Transcript_28412/g.54149 Transcript_28412/m.54149 type:complete len:285 (-) Transcript_28412:769-1623(-)|eukprot:CAMPEP_0114234284 /NCGR_PEP_ID=MMETSP0058-20121206/5630_1 /TAXON_ID=36894 /ORGANISM="Pyramimonas parkeae, CCMP726" /LENGTH=284 /DNA_ID=CAMNT_0001345959 /DNA_START=53 /DNA_END=907 /DNA_ORIENTATION=+
MAMAKSAAERKFVEDGLLQDLRLDGRSRYDIRPINLQPSVIPQASGSARVRLGGTDVLVGVKVEIGTPLPDHPACGRMMFSVDVAPTASPSFEGRGADALATQLTHALTQCFGGSASGSGAAFAPKDLGIIPGRTCWVVYVDGLVLAADGSVLDVLAIATKAALADMRVPKVSVVGGTSEEDPLDFEVDEDASAFLQLPMDGVPVVVTLRQCGRHYYVDATSDEEALTHPGMSISVNSKGEVCGMLKTGAGGIDPSAIREIVEVAQRLGKEIHEAVDKNMVIAV